jgi:hypothetical protein
MQRGEAHSEEANASGHDEASRGEAHTLEPE